MLGSWDVTFDAGAARKYLADVREELPLYAELGIAHPGWVLRLANRILSGNVVLGPWIHVGSAVRHHGLVHDGVKVELPGNGRPRNTSARGTDSYASTSASSPTSSSSPPSTTPPSTSPARSPPPVDAASVQRPTTSGSPTARFTSTPKRRCATRRIWISSEPSVMR